ncbi:HNH endonuclease [Aggregatimonas sangjinii]|uniref:HNH endonuclease n=1 Tax=Aggregatimonas sangjinii TaxID=2583587 RepID=A0A5B7SSG9_9FLAO|nr:HNH endonuclease [Aggregatimonas sangjinii]QCX01152.1 HNH endonuclease [Aggregatimonas sangjinii]
MIEKKCIWCLKSEHETDFFSKAHTIPKSLGGQNFNPNVCDVCNAYFGNRHEYNYSIEEALKEAFNITRIRLRNRKSKRKVGRFKSKFFEVKERKGKYRLTVKPSFRFNSEFQTTLCRAFKRGLYKMFFEELNRQKKVGFEKKYDLIRQFARYDMGNLPVFYFERSVGIIVGTDTEYITPVLIFNRMTYLHSTAGFEEIEFLGHVFGFPITDYTPNTFKSYMEQSIRLKKEFFKGAILINRMTDVDIVLSVMNG